MADEVTAGADVPLTCEAAFALFSSGLGSRWPPEFSWSQGGLEKIGMEARPGGFLYEKGPRGEAGEGYAELMKRRAGPTRLSASARPRPDLGANALPPG